MERTERATAAAIAAARERGLAASEATVLYDVFSVVVRLEPDDVVVRVPTVLPPTLGADLEAQAARQQRELDAVTWLAAKGVPIVPASPLVEARPAQVDGFSMTFWQWVEVVEGADADLTQSVARVAELHAAMRDLPGELPFLSPLATIPGLLDVLDRSPDLIDTADLERARQEWRTIDAVLGSADRFAAAFPTATVQPIHGDSPAYNTLMTTDGARFGDFEDVTLGPVEWDLNLSGPDAIAAYDEAAGALGLRPTDPDVLAMTEAAGLLLGVVCLALVPQLPMLADGLQPLLEMWRERSPLGSPNDMQ